MTRADDVSDKVVDVGARAYEQRKVCGSLAGCRSSRWSLTNARYVVVRRGPTAVVVTVRRIRWIFFLKFKIMLFWFVLIIIEIT